MTETKQKEVWRVYPKIQFIEASNLGRVRTKNRTVIRSNGRKLFVKGRVLKQRLSKDGYLFVQFSVNGKHFRVSVHRIIATSFLPNKNNYPEVNHIDCNPTNNAVSNLEWCTHEYNVAYKEKYGVSSAEAVGRPVFAVNLETSKVSRFETQSEAARQLGVDVGNLNNVVKGKVNQAGGYWFTEDESEITEEKTQEIKANMRFRGGVIAINLYNFKVLWFESQKEASRQLRVNAGNISSVVEGYRRQAGSHWFCNADENAVEKTREKFDDKVAHEVEKLIGENYD